MSVDRRLREGLGRSAMVVDPELRATLPDALARGRRRKRFLRAANAAALIVSIASVAFLGPQLLRGIRSERPATTPTPPVPAAFARIAGTYTAHIEPHTTALPDSGMVGSWTLELGVDGTLSLSAPLTFKPSTSSASFEVTGHRFQTNLLSTRVCNGTIGTYAWGLSGDRLRFTKINDRCPIREAIFGARQWGDVTPASISASALGETPVVPDDGSGLLPGLYTTAFQPKIRFSIAGPWTGNNDTSDWIDIELGPSDLAGRLEFFRISSVFAPGTRQALPLPGDLVAWFTSHPAVAVVSPPQQTTLGGLKATQFDVRLAKDWRCTTPQSCVAFAPLMPGEPGWGWSADAGPRLRCRVLLLQVQGDTVVVTFTSSRSRFRDGLSAAEDVLSTVEFG
jgi:hypothetical protein